MISLEHRIVAFTSCTDVLLKDQLEGVQFELAVTNATSGEKSKQVQLNIIGSSKGVCKTEPVNGLIKELHLGYYSGKIQRISFATNEQIYVTGEVNSK